MVLEALLNTIAMQYLVNVSLIAVMYVRIEVQASVIYIFRSSINM